MERVAWDARYTRFQFRIPLGFSFDDSDYGCPLSFSRQTYDLDASGHRTDAQAHAKSIAVAQNDFAAIGGAVRIESDAFVKLRRWRAALGPRRFGRGCRLNRCCGLIGSRGCGWLLAHCSDLNFDSSVERSLAAGDVF